MTSTPYNVALPIDDPLVTIVLSTFNGERYLAEQLDSICNQTYSNWHVRLRDDGSTDATPQIIAEVVRQNPKRFSLEPDSGKNLGVVASYSTLLGQAVTQYILLSDQDDVWLPNKIEATLAAMRAAEKQFGSTTPLLVHTDLQVVNQRLEPVAPSFWQYRQLDPYSGIQLPRLLTQNVVTGCTTMINSALAKLAAPFPNGVAMHDWWLALVASLFGQVVAVAESTMLYRQHTANSVGAIPWGWRRMCGRAGQMQLIRQVLLASMGQAALFLNRYGDHLQPAQQAMIAAYASLPFQTRRRRLKTLLIHRFCKNGFMRTMGFIALVVALQTARDTSNRSGS